MEWADWAIVAAYIVFITVVGLLFIRRAGGSVAEFFVAGRNLPWWLAGTSLIATSFAADTPLAITGIVAEHGIAGNWLWWNQVVAWILAVVIFARLWRRSGLLTDAEFAEVRYGGRGGSFLRVFKAFYYSVIVSTYTLAWVMLAMQKIVAATMPTPEWTLALQHGIETSLGISPGAIDLWKWIVLVGLFFVAAFYTVLSGFWGIVVTDLIQFAIAMVASILFAVFAVHAVGGMSSLNAQLVERFGREGFDQMTSFLPAMDSAWMPFSTFVIFLSVLWWGDCGGFAAQRMFSTRSDRDSVLTALWYSVMHFAVRPWPWIIVALVTLVYYPDLTDREAGYPMLMMEILPAGLRGLMVASLLAAFMSTVDTHLNWNASYFVNDIYKRFLAPGASERRCVFVSRLATVGFAALAILVAYFMTSIKNAWVLLFNLQAGIGMVLMLRWLWWRINAWSEISAMLTSLVATGLVHLLRSQYQLDWSDAFCILITVVACTIIWVSVTLLTPACDVEKLRAFYRRVHPPAWFWDAVLVASDRKDESVAQRGGGAVATWCFGAAGLYAAMFAIGNFVLLRPGRGAIASAVCIGLCSGIVMLNPSLFRSSPGHPTGD